MTPEKFVQEGHDLNVSLICIDEVHSISPLSHTFRSIYTSLANTELQAPILGLTAPC